MPTSSPRKADALIAFGANEGDCEAALQKTLQVFENDDCILELNCSESISTQAVTGSENDSPQNGYLNAVFRVLTTYKISELHQCMIAIEKMLGREREHRWGPRTIDLDLLLFGDLQLESAELTVPHPRMSFRRFVLRPALDVAADMVHPVSGMTLQQLVDHLDEDDRHVVLAAKDTEFLRSIVENLEFDIHIVQNVEEFMAIASRARIVVTIIDESDHDQPTENLFRFATNFAGPTLRIDQTVGLKNAEKEMRAAIEAMRKL